MREEVIIIDRRFKRVWLVVLSLIILLGVALTIWMLLARRNNDNIKVRVEIDDINIPKRVEINDYVLVPGYENEYVLSVTADKPGDYDVTFSFVEKGNKDNILKENLYVLIEYDGDVICNDKLSELFDENSEIQMELKRHRGQEIKVVYYIPIEVGNEIQGQVIDFDLYITAKEKRN